MVPLFPRPSYTAVFSQTRHAHAVWPSVDFSPDPASPSPPFSQVAPETAPGKMPTTSFFFSRSALIVVLRDSFWCQRAGIFHRRSADSVHSPSLLRRLLKLFPPVIHAFYLPSLVARRFFFFRLYGRQPPLFQPRHSSDGTRRVIIKLSFLSSFFQPGMSPPKQRSRCFLHSKNTGPHI